MFNRKQKLEDVLQDLRSQVSSKLHFFLACAHYNPKRKPERIKKLVTKNAVINTTTAVKDYANFFLPELSDTDQSAPCIYFLNAWPTHQQHKRFDVGHPYIRNLQRGW